MSNQEMKVGLRVEPRNPIRMEVKVLTDPEGRNDPDGMQFWMLSQYCEQLTIWADGNIIITDTDTFTNSQVFMNIGGVVIVVTHDPNSLKSSGMRTRNDKNLMIYHTSSLQEAMLIAFRAEGTGFNKAIKVFGESLLVSEALGLADDVLLTMIYDHGDILAGYESIPLELDLRAFKERLTDGIAVLFGESKPHVMTKINPANGIPQPAYGVFAFSRKPLEKE